MASISLFNSNSLWGAMQSAGTIPAANASGQPKSAVSIQATTRLTVWAVS